MPLYLDGGNFVNNTSTVFLTNKILEDNRELSKSEVIHILQDYTRLRPEIIERSKSDNIGHTDGILLVSTFNHNDNHHPKKKKMPVKSASSRKSCGLAKNRTWI